MGMTLAQFICNSFFEKSYNLNGFANPDWDYFWRINLGWILFLCPPPKVLTEEHSAQSCKTRGFLQGCVVDTGYGLGGSPGDCRPTSSKGQKYQMVKTQAESHNCRQIVWANKWQIWVSFFFLRFAGGQLEFVTQLFFWIKMSYSWFQKLSY